MSDGLDALDHVHRAACAEHGCALLPPSPAPVTIQRGASVPLQVRVLGVGAGLAAVHLAFNTSTVGVVSALDAQHAPTGTVLLISGVLTTVVALVPAIRKRPSR